MLKLTATHNADAQPILTVANNPPRSAGIAGVMLYSDARFNNNQGWWGADIGSLLWRTKNLTLTTENANQIIADANDAVNYITANNIAETATTKGEISGGLLKINIEIDKEPIF